MWFYLLKYFTLSQAFTVFHNQKCMPGQNRQKERNISKCLVSYQTVLARSCNPGVRRKHFPKKFWCSILPNDVSIVILNLSCSWMLSCCNCIHSRAVNRTSRTFTISRLLIVHFAQYLNRFILVKALAGTFFIGQCKISRSPVDRSKLHPQQLCCDAHLSLSAYHLPHTSPAHTHNQSTSPTSSHPET